LRLGTPFNLVDGVTQFRRALTQHSLEVHARELRGRDQRADRVAPRVFDVRRGLRVTNGIVVEVQRVESAQRVFARRLARRRGYVDQDGLTKQFRVKGESRQLPRDAVSNARTTLFLLF
jgi:hypothetical protein